MCRAAKRMDSRSKAPARRSSFVSPLPSPYSRPSQFRHPGRSIRFQAPPSNIGDPVARESSAVNVVVLNQLAPETMPDAPNTPGTVLPSLCSYLLSPMRDRTIFWTCHIYWMVVNSIDKGYGLHLNAEIIFGTIMASISSSQLIIYSICKIRCKTCYSLAFQIFTTFTLAM